MYDIYKDTPTAVKDESDLIDASASGKLYSTCSDLLLFICGWDKLLSDDSKVVFEKCFDKTPKRIKEFIDEENEQMIEKLLDLLRQIHSQTLEGMKEQSKWDKVKIYLNPFENNIFNNVLFGRFDYMRADLEANHSGQ